jgi:hypothetical protein
LNFNDFYSHNIIQEHFITPRKVCKGMNATNNYLFKYITLSNSILFKIRVLQDDSAEFRYFGVRLEKARYLDPRY